MKVTREGDKVIIILETKEEIGSLSHLVNNSFGCSMSEYFKMYQEFELGMKLANEETTKVVSQALYENLAGIVRTLESKESIT